ncbi:MAG: hypothetical protein IJZ51_00100 [Ruminiclostridium sp.]|nr:hypothetical protein [Ruminiclostridium sp.]
MTIIKKISSLLLVISLTLSIMMMAGCNEEEEKEEKLGPKDIFYKVMDLIEDEEYTEAANYCRTFSAYSVERYFSETDTEFQMEWTARYSRILLKLFKEYVTFDRIEEVMDEENRVATVSGIFTSVNLEKLNKTIEYKVNSELKDDFDKQMDYIESVIGNDDLKSVPFRFEIKFRYTNKQWRFDDENFLILLTLGYYAR